MTRIPLPHDKGVARVAVNVDIEKSNVTRHSLCVTAASSEGPSVGQPYAPLTGSSKSRGW